MFYLAFFLFENDIAFGLAYAGIALAAILYLIVTMDENGVQFSLHPVKQWRKRKEWQERQRLAKELKEGAQKPE